MKLALKSYVGQCLLAACFVFGAVSANAQKAIVVTPALEKEIKVGMTEAEVVKVLGKPLMVEKFGKSRRPTYVYKMEGAGAVEPYTVQLYVSFDEAGKVRRAAREFQPGYFD